MKKQVYQQPYCEVNTILTENFIALSVPIGGGSTGLGGPGGGGQAKSFTSFDNEEDNTEESNIYLSHYNTWE